ncbi:MAG: serine/threonine-protein kinase [Gammaproteobacteria bacterium]
MSVPNHRNALPCGHQLLWYRIEKVLGQGGFGVTYLATDTKLKRSVAIKEYLPIDLAVREQDHSLHAFNTDRERMYRWGLDRFLQEAQTLAQFSHPHIVQVYSFFETNNTAYMVMRYEEGESLARLLNEGQFHEQKSLLKLLLPLLDGLEKVHNAGLIHRDIKPANIFVRQTGSPVLLDFGSARQVVGTQTRTVTSLVSVGYAPLEQYEPEGGKQGPWTDIYALGATLYIAVTGRAPTDALIRGHAHLERKPDPLKHATDAVGSYFQPRFLQAIDKALELLPADRPQSIAEWRQLFPQLTETKRSRRHWAWAGAAVASLLMAAVLAHQMGWWKAMDNHQSSVKEHAIEQITAARGEKKAAVPQKIDPQVDAVDQENQEKQRLPELALRRERQEAASEQQASAAAAARLEREVSELLARAKQQRQQGRLTLPPGDNAYESYQRVLMLVPAHREAKSGLDAIANDYQRLAAARRQEGELQKSLNLIRSGLRVAPDHVGLQALQDQVNAQLAARVEPKQPQEPSESVWDGVTLIKKHAEKVDDVVPPVQ